MLADYQTGNKTWAEALTCESMAKIKTPAGMLALRQTVRDKTLDSER